MKRIGFHLSIASGFSHLIEEAVSLSCNTLQIFSRSPRSWFRSEFNEKEVEFFKRKLKKYDIKPLVIHLPYLPNPATPKKLLRKKTIKVIKEELRSCESLGAEYLVIHTGKFLSGTREDGIKRVQDVINEVLLAFRGEVKILLENTAGAGTEIGCNFYELRKILDGIERKRKIGFCLDTAHLFQSGYDLRTKDKINAVLDEFDRLLGIEKLYLVHYNDSKTELSSRVDRHYHIGRGK
ncbi:MAG: endonuclease, partial [Caldiserica bacterium]